MQTASSAGSVKRDFVAAHRAVAQGGLARAVGNVKPFDVFQRAAPVADKMMVRMDGGVEERRLAFGCQLAHQTGARQIPQRVVNRGPRDQRQTPVQRRINLIRRGVNRSPRQVFQHAVALGRPPQPARAQTLVQIGFLGFRLQKRLD